MSTETETRSAPDLSLVRVAFLCATTKGTSTELPREVDTSKRKIKPKIRYDRAMGVVGVENSGGRRGLEACRDGWRLSELHMLSQTPTNHSR